MAVVAATLPPLASLAPSSVCVCEAVAASARSWLGADVKIKSIVEHPEGTGELVSGSLALCRSLAIQHPCRTLLVSACEGMSTLSRSATGCTSLLVLAAYWARTLLNLHHQGVLPSHLSQGIELAIKVCSDALLDMAVSVPSLPAPTGVSQRFPRRRIASRHLFVPETTPQADVLRLCQQLCNEPLPALASKVLGCAKARASEASTEQIWATVRDSLDQAVFVTACVAPGLPCVLEDSVLLTVEDAVSQLGTTATREHWCGHAAIVDGDCSPNALHLGQQADSQVLVQRDIFTTADQMSSLSAEDRWLVACEAVLLNLGIQLLVVRGRATKRLCDLCARHGIVLSTRVSSATLQALCRLTGTRAASSLPSLRETHCCSLKLSLLMRFDHVVGLVASLPALRVGGKFVVTTALFARTRQQADDLHRQFLVLLDRALDALCTKKVLPGGGASELRCASRLRAHAVQGDRRLVLHSVAHGLERFAQDLRANLESAGCYRDDKADAFALKQETWSRALGVAQLVLLSGPLLHLRCSGL
eukprot:m.270468 g.270468  ORF g.270468 m.270468 type:complete len:534 (-) comp19316_c0_seq1:1255-2856(-)